SEKPTAARYLSVASARAELRRASESCKAVHISSNRLAAGTPAPTLPVPDRTFSTYGLKTFQSRSFRYAGNSAACTAGLSKTKARNSLLLNTGNRGNQESFAHLRQVLFGPRTS